MPMTDGIERRRNTLLACMTMLRRRAPQITVTEIMVFLYVAENSGVRVKELAHLMATTPATASRAARALVSIGDPGALPPSRGWLVMSSNDREKISRHLYLTPLGAQITEQLDALIGRSQPIFGRAGEVWSASGS
jgi:DNA-binding MarR family transcriptional regulator